MPNATKLVKKEIVRLKRELSELDRKQLKAQFKTLGLQLIR